MKASLVVCLHEKHGLDKWVEQVVKSDNGERYCSCGPLIKP